MGDGTNNAPDGVTDGVNGSVPGSVPDGTTDGTNGNAPDNAQGVSPVTTREMLDNVNAAIMAITVGGQSYKIGSRSLTRADLKQLYAMKNDLTAQIAAEKSSGLFDDCYTAVFDGR